MLCATRFQNHRARPGSFVHSFQGADELARDNGHGLLWQNNPLPFQEDGARDEDASIPGYLEEWHTRDYSALGYYVVRVPVLAPQERLAFVLERLSEHGLISQLDGADWSPASPSAATATAELVIF